MTAISVALPVYNGERYLGVAIESVLGQTCGDFELIVTDNASTDGTEAIAREYAARDARVRYVRNTVNVGAAGNYCRGFERARGRYFRWLAADDYLAPAALEASLRVLEEHADVAVCTSAADIVDEHGHTLYRYADAQALEQPRALARFRAVMQQDPWCIALYGLMRRATLQRTALLGPFSGSDCTLLAELALHGRFVQLPLVLFYRRVHPDAYSYRSDAQQVQAFYAPQQRASARLRLREWQHRRANLGALWRAPLPSGERAAVALHVLRLVWWKRADMVRELVGAASRS